MPTIHPVAAKFPVVTDIARALGIERPFCRLVIEIDATKPMTAYVVAPVDLGDAEKLPGLIRVLQVESVTVAADAAVTVVPRSNT
jgi:hypothetical protein